MSVSRIFFCAPCGEADAPRERSSKLGYSDKALDAIAWVLQYANNTSEKLPDSDILLTPNRYMVCPWHACYRQACKRVGSPTALPTRYALHAAERGMDRCRLFISALVATHVHVHVGSTHVVTTFQTDIWEEYKGDVFAAGVHEYVVFSTFSRLFNNAPELKHIKVSELKRNFGRCVHNLTAGHPPATCLPVRNRTARHLIARHPTDRRPGRCSECVELESEVQSALKAHDGDRLRVAKQKRRCADGSQHHPTSLISHT